MGGVLVSNRFGVIYRDLVDWEGFSILGVFGCLVCIPPLEVCCFWQEIHMIFYVLITIISGRNKYRKISKSTDALSIPDITKELFRECRESVGSVGKNPTFPKLYRFLISGSFGFCLHSLQKKKTPLREWITHLDSFSMSGGREQSLKKGNDNKNIERNI